MAAETYWWFWQYELVAELFREEDEAMSTAKTKRGGPLVRASKEAQKPTQQLRQHKKTVGSQVLLSFDTVLAQ